jgi:hypothetical protein
VIDGRSNSISVPGMEEEEKDIHEYAGKISEMAM